MGTLDWYDTNHDGHYSLAEIDRWQLDNGGYPGQFENEHSEDELERVAAGGTPWESRSSVDAWLSARERSNSPIDFEAIAADVDEELTCFDCKHWPDRILKGSRGTLCRIWAKVFDDIEESQEAVYCKRGDYIPYEAFSQGSPAFDNEICIYFELREDDAPGEDDASGSGIEASASAPDDCE